MSDEDEEDAALAARLRQLGHGLATQKATSDTENKPFDMPKADNMGQAMSLGMRVMAEFVAGVVVGLMLGWQFDKWFGTSPVLLIIFLSLGTAAGFWNVYRIAAAPTSAKTSAINQRNDEKPH